MFFSGCFSGCLLVTSAVVCLSSLLGGCLLAYACLRLLTLAYACLRLLKKLVQKYAKKLPKHLVMWNLFRNFVVCKRAPPPEAKSGCHIIDDVATANN